MIRLFKCYSCWYVFDDEILYSGKHLSCSCGDQYFKAANPTLFNIFKYIIFHRLYALKRIFGMKHA